MKTIVKFGKIEIVLHSNVIHEHFSIDEELTILLSLLLDFWNK